MFLIIFKKLKIIFILDTVTFSLKSKIYNNIKNFQYYCFMVTIKF